MVKVSGLGLLIAMYFLDFTVKKIYAAAPEGCSIEKSLISH
jgi:hypothetical protein